MSYVLVTGGAGFIGRRIAAARIEVGNLVSLLNAGHPAAVARSLDGVDAAVPAPRG